MKKVIVFFNTEPVRAISLMDGVSRIYREYPNGEEVHLQVIRAAIPLAANDSQELYVAADRDVTPGEVLEAAKKLLRIRSR